VEIFLDDIDEHEEQAARQAAQMSGECFRAFLVVGERRLERELVVRRAVYDHPVRVEIEEALVGHGSLRT